MHQSVQQNHLVLKGCLAADWYLELVGMVTQLDLEQKAVLSCLNLGLSLQLCHQVVQQTLSFGLICWTVQLNRIPVEEGASGFTGLISFVPIDRRWCLSSSDSCSSDSCSCSCTQWCSAAAPNSGSI